MGYFSPKTTDEKRILIHHKILLSSFALVRENEVL